MDPMITGRPFLRSLPESLPDHRRIRTTSDPPMHSSLSLRAIHLESDIWYRYERNKMPKELWSSGLEESSGVGTPNAISAKDPELLQGPPLQPILASGLNRGWAGQTTSMHPCNGGRTTRSYRFLTCLRSIGCL